MLSGWIQSVGSSISSLVVSWYPLMEPIFLMGFKPNLFTMTFRDFVIKPFKYYENWEYVHHMHFCVRDHNRLQYYLLLQKNACIQREFVITFVIFMLVNLLANLNDHIWTKNVWMLPKYQETTQVVVYANHEVQFYLRCPQ